jgi:PHD/YefM family antitoxin component YafN of YafNO toxin-antitoxin module
MPERLTSISKARAKLPRLSQNAQKRLDRYVITLQGQPQSVLVGFDEYQGMKAAVELMQRPEVVEDIKAGLKELDEGKGVPLTEMKARVHEARRLRETNKFAEELAAESGVDSHTVETVMCRLGEKMNDVFSTKKSIHIPGVGEIVCEIIVEDPRTNLPGKAAIPTRFSSKPQRHLVLKKIRRPVKPASAKQEVLLPETEKES